MRANCIICTDLFDEISSISAAKCGHVYHSNCLTLWVGHSKSCPHCRARITINDIHKLYFNFPSKSDLNSSQLENEVLNLKAQLSAKDVELLACKKAKDDTVAFVREAEKRASDLQQTVYKCESEISELRLRVKSAAKLEAKLLKLEQMNVALTNDLEHLNNVKTIVNGTQKDIDSMLKNYADKSEATVQLATYCSCLKRELQRLKESRDKLVEVNAKLQKQNSSFAAKVKFFEEAMSISSSSINKQEQSSTCTKKFPIFHSNENNSVVNSASKSGNNSEEMDISPLPAPFSKNKFNMCIKSSTTVSYKSDSGSSQNCVKHTSVTSVPMSKENNSIIKTGYNGFGGHSNFINVEPAIKKPPTSKLKKVCGHSNFINVEPAIKNPPILKLKKL